MELVHVEYQREAAGQTLRIYIDKPGGVALDDCVRISRQMNDLLNVYTENSGSYRLEVSSPGPDRPLGRAYDFEKFKGSDVRIRTAQPLDGQKSFTGRLLGLTEGVVNLMITDKTVAIPFREIKKARLINHNGES
jgi:ribosome maturation factor RimP